MESLQISWLDQPYREWHFQVTHQIRTSCVHFLGNNCVLLQMKEGVISTKFLLRKPTVIKVKPIATKDY